MSLSSRETLLCSQLSWKILLCLSLLITWGVSGIWRACVCVRMCRCLSLECVCTATLAPVLHNPEGSSFYACFPWTLWLLWVREVTFDTVRLHAAMAGPVGRRLCWNVDTIRSFYDSQGCALSSRIFGFEHSLGLKSMSSSQPQMNFSSQPRAGVNRCLFGFCLGFFCFVFLEKQVL